MKPVESWDLQKALLLIPWADYGLTLGMMFEEQERLQFWSCRHESGGIWEIVMTPKLVARQGYYLPAAAST
jgi:hypothetical protein